MLTNACKYTPPSGETTITAYPQSENRIRLSVCNTGVQIPANELTRIFDKFYRIPTSDRYQQGGTGLGLALVKKLVIHLGGASGLRAVQDKLASLLIYPSHHPTASLGNKLL